MADSTKSRLLSLVVGGALVIAVSACTALLQSDAAQCSTNADCAARGLGNLTCSADGVCIDPTVLVTPANDAPTGCENDDLCTAQNGGLASICRERGSQCTNIATTDCEVSGNYRDRNAIFIGTINHKSSNFGSGAILNNMIIMAHNEITAALPDGLQGGPNGARRPLVLVNCHGWGAGEAAYPARLKALSEHLVNVVNVPILQSQGDPEYLAAQPVIAASGKSIFHYVHSTSIDARLTYQGTGDLSTVFQGLLPVTDVAAPMAAEVPLAEAQVRATPGFAGGDIRVAALIEKIGGNYEEALVAKIEETLKFNNKTVAENGANYKQVTNEWMGAVDAPVQEIVAHRPHIIILATKAIRALLPLLEASWPSNVPRPLYIGHTYHAAGTTFDLIQGNEDMRKRFRGLIPLSPPLDDAKHKAFLAKYAQTFPGSTTSNSFVYDAYYAITYAIVGAGAPTGPGGKLTGADVVRGLPKIAGGTNAPRFFVGPSDLIAAMGQLVNVPINLEGFLLPLEWDQATGKPPLPQTAFVYCVGRKTDGTLEVIPGSQIWNYETKTMYGNFLCP